MAPIRDVVFIKDSISILNNSEIFSKPWWLGWTNLANNLRLMTVKILRSVNSKWEITKLYFKNKKEDQQTNNVLQHLHPTTMVMKE